MLPNLFTTQHKDTNSALSC